MKLHNREIKKVKRLEVVFKYISEVNVLYYLTPLLIDE